MKKNNSSNPKKFWKNYLKAIKRDEEKRQRNAGEKRHEATMNRTSRFNGNNLKSQKSSFAKEKYIPPLPQYPESIKFMLSQPEIFSQKKYKTRENGILEIPQCFSLVDNYQESFDFLKRLFLVLHRRNVNEVILDYKNCERIDVDASICMDVMLAEFITYFKQCNRIGYKIFAGGGITPKNFEKENIQKVLFSIGAYRNLKGIKIDYSDVEDLPVLVNDNRSENVWSKSELDLTKIVEYIKSCLKRLNRQLTADSENEFYKVIGEVMSNALEHGSRPKSYSIGYFQEIHNDDDEHFGVFNFTIFNFGNTIYQTFKNEDCKNKQVVNQMTELSEDYTKKGFFSNATFEEETLWTLYALQEGVTSKDKKRGNGSIQYIENFFKLKGDLCKDDISKLVILSGNTRILFDGTYSIVEKMKSKSETYKVITFNESGEISDLPDKNFVNFAPHFFPGALISARILIKYDNTKNSENGIHRV